MGDFSEKMSSVDDLMTSAGEEVALLGFDSQSEYCKRGHINKNRVALSAGE